MKPVALVNPPTPVAGLTGPALTSRLLAVSVKHVLDQARPHTDAGAGDYEKQKRQRISTFAVKRMVVLPSMF